MSLHTLIDFLKSQDKKILCSKINRSIYDNFFYIFTKLYSNIVCGGNVFENAGETFLSKNLVNSRRGRLLHNRYDFTENSYEQVNS